MTRSSSTPDVTPQPSTDPLPSRRAVLASGAVGVAAAVTACGASSGAAPGGSAAPAGATLARVADVPVGGGVILTDLKVVLTQPTAGQFAGYSSICPHQGCPVSEVKDGFIDCTCHGSRFAVATGAPTPDSPAKSPLAPLSVTVKGADVILG